MFENWKFNKALRLARDGEPARLDALLKVDPQKIAAVAEEALIDLQNNAPWHALILCLSLARVDADETLTVVERLLEAETPRRYPDAWNRLTPADLLALLHVLDRLKRTDVRQRLIGSLNSEQLTGITPGPEDSGFLEMLELFLSQKRPLAHIRELILKTVYQTITTDRMSRTLRVCLLAGVKLLRWGHVDEALPIFSAIDLQTTGLVRKPLLRRLANELATRSLDRILRIAELLERHPCTEWIEPLRDVWLRIDEQALQTGEKRTDTMPVLLEDGGNAVASALGACAAADEAYSNFDADDAIAPGLREKAEKLEPLIDEHNSLVKDYEKNYAALVTGPGRPAGESSYLDKLSEQIKKLRQRIEMEERQMQDLRRQHRQSLSAGFLLWWVLLQAQGYPIGLRQAAAWGLHLLVSRGHLNAQTKDKVLSLIKECVTADDDQAFCERRLHFRADHGPVERLHCLQKALSWMIHLVEPHQTDDDPPMADAISLASSPQLRQILDLIHAFLPGAERFLNQYPLRLMPLRRHKRILGEYSRTRCQLQLWTTYTPPKQVGKVHSRYLVPDDRSAPNSMGIYYRLFCHPLLVLPVIYHEFLHYGGPAGNPQQGIENEMEVLMREMLFARSLMAKLAPAAETQLYSFEVELQRQARAVNFESLLYQLNYNLEDDIHLQDLNRTVIETYGAQRSESEAEQEVNAEIVRRNATIDLENRTQTWDEKVLWPLLGKPETSHVTDEFTRILKRSMVRAHEVSPSRRDQILADPVCQNHIAGWQQYRQRANALRCLTAEWPEEATAAARILRLIVRRFELETETGRLIALLRYFVDHTPSPSAGDAGKDADLE